jgi:hypothetical protein
MLRNGIKPISEELANELSYVYDQINPYKEHIPENSEYERIVYNFIVKHDPLGPYLEKHCDVGAFAAYFIDKYGQSLTYSKGSRTVLNAQEYNAKILDMLSEEKKRIEHENGENPEGVMFGTGK